MRKKTVAKRKKTAQASSMLGTVHANVQMPESLHDAMRTIRHIRHRKEGADVKLCRIYREAVEQYVMAKPQQDLLKGWGRKKTA